MYFFDKSYLIFSVALALMLLVSNSWKLVDRTHLKIYIVKPLILNNALIKSVPLDVIFKFLKDNAASNVAHI